MKAWLILPCVLALAACSDKPPEPVAQSAAKPASIATPFDGMRADVQRAKDVQNVVDKHAAEQRKQIEAQTQ